MQHPQTNHLEQLMKFLTRRRVSACVATCCSLLALTIGASGALGQVVARASVGTASVADVRRLLSGLAADSMEGRGLGTIGSVRASVLIANEFRNIGLEPAGVGGSYFQELPFVRTVVDPATSLSVGGQQLPLWTDYSIPVTAGARGSSGDMQVMYGGLATDSTFTPAAAAVAGKIVVLLTPPAPAAGRAVVDAGAAGARGGRGPGRGGRGGIAGASRFAGASAIAILAADALSGRAGSAATGVSPGSATAAPASPIAITVSRRAAELLLGAAPEGLPPGALGRVARLNIAYQTTQPVPTRNVAGILRGHDPALRDEFILVDAHYDHLGMRSGAAAGGDSVFNGADDDASGTVAVMEIARALRKAPPPKRSVIFVATTGEERGLVGTNYFIANPLVPLNRIVANLEIEMIGRPDSLAGGSGKGWLTGYERSTMGPTLAAAGIPVVIDPRPSQNFFGRSDNIAFARMGIVAHTLSSFNLHSDYHQVSDDVDKVDYQHMTTLINAAIRSVDVLANGARQTWNPGGQPTSGRGGPSQRNQ